MQNAVFCTFFSGFAATFCFFFFFPKNLDKKRSCEQASKPEKKNNAMKSQF